MQRQPDVQQHAERAPAPAGAGRPRLHTPAKMVNEAEFAALQAAKKAKKAAASEKKLQRDAERKKRKKGDDGEGEAPAPAAAEEAFSARDYDGRAEPAVAAAAAAASSAPTPVRAAAPPATAELVDQTITCVDCGNDFLFSVGEQQFFLSNGYASGNQTKRSGSWLSSPFRVLATGG